MIDAYKEQNHQNPSAKQNEHQPAKVVPLVRGCLIELLLGETLLRDESLTAPQWDHSGVSFVLRQEEKSQCVSESVHVVHPTPALEIRRRNVDAGEENGKLNGQATEYVSEKLDREKPNEAEANGCKPESCNRRREPGCKKGIRARSKAYHLPRGKNTRVSK